MHDNMLWRARAVYLSLAGWAKPLDMRISAVGILGSMMKSLRSMKFVLLAVAALSTGGMRLACDFFLTATSVCCAVLVDSHKDSDHEDHCKGHDKTTSSGSNVPFRSQVSNCCTTWFYYTENKSETVSSRVIGSVLENNSPSAALASYTVDGSDRFLRYLRDASHGSRAPDLPLYLNNHSFRI